MTKVFNTPTLNPVQESQDIPCDAVYDGVGTEDLLDTQIPPDPEAVHAEEVLITAVHTAEKVELSPAGRPMRKVKGRAKPSGRGPPGKKSKKASTEVKTVAEPEWVLRSTGSPEYIVGFGKLRPEQVTFHGKEVPTGFSVLLLTKIVKAKTPLPVPNLNDDPPQTVLADALNSLVLWPTESLGTPPTVMS